MPPLDPQAIKDAGFLDTEKVRRFTETARGQGHSAADIETYIGTRKADFRWKPQAQPVGSGLAQLPGAIKDEVLGGGARGLRAFGQGVKESESEFFYPLLGNIAALGERGAAAVSPLPEGQESGIQTIFRKGRELAERGSELTAVRPEDRLRGEGITEKVIRGAGAAPVTLGTYAAATALTGNPVTAMAAVDALRASDRGVAPALEGGVRGALFGKALKATEVLKPLMRSSALATLFGGSAAAEGGDASDITTQGILGFGLGQLGGRSVRPRGREFNILDKSRATARENIPPIGKKAAAIEPFVPFGPRRGLFPLDPRGSIEGRGPAVTPDTQAANIKLLEDVPLATERGALTEPIRNKGAVRLGFEVDKGTQRLREVFNAPDVRTPTYQKTIKAVEDWRIGRNAAALQSQQVRKLANKIVPDKARQALVRDAIDDPALVKELATPQERHLYNSARMMFKNYESVLAQEGILGSFHENYVNRIILESPKGEAPGGVGAGGKLGTKPGFTRQRVLKDDGTPYTTRELKGFGYKTVDDLGQLMGWYKLTAEQALANKRLVKFLENAKAPDGTPALKARSEIPPNELTTKRYKPIQEAALQKWSGRTLDKRTTTLFKEDVFLHRDVWETVDNVIGKEFGANSEFYKGLSRGRANVRRVIMYNPLIHGNNVESQVIMTLGHRYPKRFSFLRNLGEEGVERLKTEMVQGGVELEGLFDKQMQLTQDVSKFKVSPESVSKNPLVLLRDASDRFLWEKWIGSGQMIVFADLKAKFMRKGMPEQEAIQSAGNMTNDLMGSLPKTWFTKPQRTMLSNLMFARNWTVSNLRTLTGALGTKSKSGLVPKPLRFEGLNDAQLKAMGQQYRKIILKGVVGSIVSANMLQAMFLKANDQPFHPTWENEEGHRMDIDTGTSFPTGGERFIRNWLFRQIDDYAKLLEGDIDKFTLSKMEPIMRTLIEEVGNTKLHAGERIRKRGMTTAEKAEATAKHIVGGITPLQSFTGREDRVRDWIDIALPFTGTWLRSGIPTGSHDPALADALQAFYEWRDREGLSGDKVKTAISLEFQKGNEEKALELYRKSDLSPQQLNNIRNRTEDPFFYRTATFSKAQARKGELPWKLKKDFLLFLDSLPEEQQAEYEAAVEREASRRKQERGLADGFNR
jgi:hypothetical protein